jgi:hypothetical protein
MKNALRPTHLGGATLDKGAHVCAFFRSSDEKYGVLMPFLKEGLEQGEKALHIVGPKQRGDCLRRMNDSGIDTASAESKGQLEILGWEDAYLHGGAFDQEAMLALLASFLHNARLQGFPRTRIMGEMEWALEDAKALPYGIVEYETRLNLVLPKNGDFTVCAYDLDRFGADVVIDVLRTHPMVLIGTILQRNPFFVAPEEMLQELKERRSGRAASSGRN